MGSFDADINIIGLGVIDLTEHGDDRLGDLVHFYVPLLQQTYPVFGLGIADVDEDAVFLQALVNVVYHVFYLDAGQAVDGRLLKDTVDIKIRPLPCDVYPFPPYSPFQVSLFISLLVDQGPAEIGARHILVSLFDQLAED